MKMKKLLFVTLLLASFGAKASSVYVNKIDVQGLERVETETVTSYLNIAKNKSLAVEDLDLSLKNLYATGLFADVTFNMTENGTLVVKVVENPIINKRIFDGNDKVDDKLLESEVSLAPRSIYSKAKVVEDVQRILEVYKRSGRYQVSVDPKIIRRDQNRVDLIFEIDEGPIAAIDKLSFVGNTHYTDSELQSEIMSKESRWYRLFSSAESYDAEKTNYDKELLRRFYAKRGYADFRVVSAVAELSSNKQSFVLNYVVDEGKRYKVKNITINSPLKDIDVTSLYENIQFEVGDWYNADKIEKTSFILTEELGKKGFAFVDIVPELNKNLATGDLDVVFNIEEGARIFVDKINITGNARTHDEVVRRQFRIEEGDAFNATKLKASRKNVENLNYFSKVDIQTIPQEDSNKADINVNVEEKSTGYFNVGVGYSTVNGAMLRAGVTENNFRGLGQQVSVDASVSQRTTDYNFSFTEPYFLGRNLSAGIDIFNTSYDYQDEGSYDSETTGGRVRFGWNYTDAFSQSVRYTLRKDSITNVDSGASQYVKEEEGDYTGSIFGQTVAYDKRDSSVNPKEGYYLSLGTDVAGAGGDEKFYKLDTKAYKYYTLADYYTFKFFLNAGYIEAYSDDEVRLSNRYYLGGSTLRGFAVAGIGARDIRTDDALGGNWMVYSGAEMSFPIGLDELGVKGKTFVDVGMLGKPDNMGPDIEYSDTPRVAVGFGLGWASPMGQIDIDIAFPVMKEDYDETEAFRLNFGTRL